MSEAAAKVSTDINPEKELDTATGRNASESVFLHDGREVKIHKCKLKDSAAVARAVNTVLMAMNVNSTAGIGTLDMDNPQIFLNALDIANDDITSAMAALSDMTHDDLGDLELDDALSVLLKAVEVNRDFFLKRVMGILSGFLSSAETENSQK